ncbi:putative sulfite oxidase subunit YedZ [Paraurantiacibacter namhicola]|uniref:Putative sulfite oxidase subunit YedZ n=1 Tax=Paraurantiacibacter namhicola TaxID=645517 RepID=A0A1C7D7A3_9SPHN|nr:putative sulfite oxidase subunit YedZ [Paraurantiacibacter namhicola]
MGRIYAAAIALSALAIGAAFLLAPDTSGRALLAARYTARAGFIAFCVVYLAGPGVKLWPNRLTRWLARRRRHLGLAFALVMAIHLVALAINVGWFRPRTPESMIGGGITYAFIFALALTSTDAAQRRMGKWWRRLHFIGLHVILLTFTVSYFSRLFQADYMTTGAVFAPVVMLLIVLRLRARSALAR